MPEKSLDGMKFTKLTGKCPSCQAEVKNQGRCPGCGAYFRKDGTWCFAGKVQVKPPQKERKTYEKTTPEIPEKPKEKGILDF